MLINGRPEKSYSGELMRNGRANEEVLIAWLRSRGRDVIDCRDFRVTQRMDVDCGIEDIHGKIVLAELKGDKHIIEDGNLCFEQHRINHYVSPSKMFYLGWGWRSPAQLLIVRNFYSNETFIFGFEDLRRQIGQFVADSNRRELESRVTVILTDKQKTTFNLLVPMSVLKYQKRIVPAIEQPCLDI